jgi:hypothetical protein
MTRHDPAEAGPSGQRGGCDQDTPEPPVRGSVVYLVDPEFVAAAILERRGADYCARLAAELLAPIRGLRAEVIR